MNTDEHSLGAAYYSMAVSTNGFESANQRINEGAHPEG
jgi:hypothetical protein